MSPEERRDVARKVELGGQGVAAAAGTGLGAAVLRDAYAEDHPAAFSRGVRRVSRTARRLGASPARARKLVRIARTGKPHFAQLAAGAAAAGIAGGAAHYQSISTLKQHAAERAARAKAARAAAQPVTKSAFGVDHRLF